MFHSNKSKMKARHIFGLILIFLGILFALEEFQIIDINYSITAWWPLILIIIGVYNISKQKNFIWNGLFIILLGLLFLANNFDLLPTTFWGSFWPLLLIILGLWLIFSKFSTHKIRKLAETEGQLNYFNLFSARQEAIHDDNFKGGTINILFGGAELDLRDCKLAPEGALLDINIAFGGLEITIPDDWKVIINGVPIFGGFDNKTYIDETKIPEKSPVLKINYFIIFGGIELNNRPKKR